MSKGYIRLGLKLCILISALISLGFILLLAVYSLPTGPMEENIADSVEIFRREGDYYTYESPVGVESRLDNFTDAIMLLTASNPSGGSLIDRTINARYYTYGSSPAQTIVDYYGCGNIEPFSSGYAKYWHGYVLTLKPVLMFLDYGQIRIVNTVLMLVSALSLVSVMYFKGMKRLIIPYIFVWGMIDPTAIAQSLQFSTVYYILNAASLILLLKRESLEKSKDRLPIFFCIVGCATSYFDFLTWPLATFGIPAALWLCGNTEGLKPKMEKLSLIFISWTVGYGGMWAGKWLVSVLFGYSDVISSVIGSVMTRTSTVDGYGHEFEYAELLKAIFNRFASPLARFGIIYAFFAIIYRLASPGVDKYPKSYWLPLAVQALLPFLWYLALSNHSYVHNFFTYRTLSVSIFSLLCIVPGCCKADVSGDIRLLKQGGRTAAVVLYSIAIGFAALLAVYAIPTDNMEKHLSESVETFQREGSGPVSDIMGVETRLDNYTDALMLLSAAYSGDESIIDKSLNAYRYSISPGEDTVVSLISCYGEGTAAVPVAFERFWHGYLLFLKPALWMMNYGQIRLVNAALLAICTGFLIMAMIRKGLRGYIIPYILSILLIDPFAIARSLQYSTVYYVATLASLYMLIKLDAFNDSKCKLYMFFTAVGCATSFFDLFTWPLATFGLPSIIMICTDKGETKAKIRMLIQSLAWWFTGYIGVWAGKWILATIIGGNNIVLDAVKTALFRSPIKDNGGFPLSLFEVIGDNLRHFIAPAGAAFILYILFTLFKRFSKNKEDELKADIACNGLPLVFLALIPFVWYGFLGNHSYNFHWYTYRELIISAFSVLCIFPNTIFGLAPHSKKRKSSFGSGF